MAPLVLAPWSFTVQYPVSLSVPWVPKFTQPQPNCIKIHPPPAILGPKSEELCLGTQGTLHTFRLKVARPESLPNHWALKLPLDLHIVQEWCQPSILWRTGGALITRCSYYTGINNSGINSKSAGNVNTGLNYLNGNQYHYVRNMIHFSFGVGPQ